MQINYFNSNLIDIKNFNSLDDKVVDTISKLKAFNIIYDNELLNNTIRITKKFYLSKKRIIVFGTGGSNLGARALDNININKNITIEFYDNIDPVFFEKSFGDISFENTGFIIVSKSGTTPETLSQFSSVYDIALKKNKSKQFFDNTLIITEFRKSPLYNIAKQNNCLFRSPVY